MKIKNKKPCQKSLDRDKTKNKLLLKKNTIMMLSLIKCFSLHQQKQSVRNTLGNGRRREKTPPNEPGDKIKTKTMNKHSPYINHNHYHNKSLIIKYYSKLIKYIIKIYIYINFYHSYSL